MKTSSFTSQEPFFVSGYWSQCADLIPGRGSAVTTPIPANHLLSNKSDLSAESKKMIFQLTITWAELNKSLQPLNV